MVVESGCSLLDHTQSFLWASQVPFWIGYLLCYELTMCCALASLDIILARVMVVVYKKS